MIEDVAAEMAAAGWPGFELRASAGGVQEKSSDGNWYSCNPSKPAKEWLATFFFIIEHGFTTVKVVGKGKTIAESINKAKEEAYAYNSRHRKQIHLSPTQR
jgi:hypothetical protein